MNQSDRDDLAARLANTFTPYAWKCSCNGENKDCAKVMDDDIEVAKYWQLQRIIRWIEENA